MPAYGAGRVDTTRRWFEDQGLLGRYRSVAMLGAWLHALVGEPVAAKRWADAAEHGPATGTLPDGSTTQSYLALLLRALLCRYGLDQMLADIQAALEELSRAASGGPRPNCWRGPATSWPTGPTGPTRSWPTPPRSPPTPVRCPAAAIALAERSLVAMD